MRALTERQKEVFSFIREYRDGHSYPPTIREIAERFSISVKGAWDHMKALEKKGFLRQEGNRSRALEIIESKAQPDRPEPAVSLRLLGEVAAGKPIYADEDREARIEVPASMARGTECFALRVRGDSMRDAGIMNGDVAIVESRSEASDGEIVVALVEDSVTLKRFFRENNRIRLQAENPSYPPIYTQDLRILGRLSGILRTY